MGLQVIRASELEPETQYTSGRGGQGGKRSESKNSLLLWDPKPRDLSMNSLNNSEEELGRNEPVIVAIIWEDLWIAVKCQSNVEIAGCLRKI